jgi:hypothetical protein
MALVGARRHQLTVTAGTSSIEPAIGHLSEVFGKRWRLHRREELVAGLISRLLVLLVRTAEVFKANALRAVCLIHLLLGKLNGIGEHATRRKRKQEPTPGAKPRLPHQAGSQPAKQLRQHSPGCNGYISTGYGSPNCVI